jgi:deazaflavin-dependent oxidoreductase (nitroreductase family)
MNRDQLRRWNDQIASQFRASNGVVGGGFTGMPMILLETTGRHSGQPHLTPLMVLPDGGRLVIFATAMGRSPLPDWYLNLLADPVVTVEFGDERYPALAAEIAEPERDQLFERQAAITPKYREYRRKLEREIPAVALVPLRR